MVDDRIAASGQTMILRTPLSLAQVWRSNPGGECVEKGARNYAVALFRT